MCPGEKDIIVFKAAGHRLRNIYIKPSSSRSHPPTAIQEPLQQRSTEIECIFSCLVNLVSG